MLFKVKAKKKSDGSARVYRNVEAENADGAVKKIMDKYEVYPKTVKAEPEKEVVFDTGATRIPVPEHFHYICPELERRVAAICAEGFKSYPDKDIEYAELSTGRRGLPLANHLKHARRHLNKWLSGDRTEDHLAKVAWAVMSIMHDEKKDPKCEHFNIMLKKEHQL